MSVRQPHNAGVEGSSSSLSTQILLYFQWLRPSGHQATAKSAPKSSFTRQDTSRVSIFVVRLYAS